MPRGIEAGRAAACDWHKQRLGLAVAVAAERNGGGVPACDGGGYVRFGLRWRRHRTLAVAATGT